MSDSQGPIRESSYAFSVTFRRGRNTVIEQTEVSQSDGQSIRHGVPSLLLMEGKMNLSSYGDRELLAILDFLQQAQEQAGKMLEGYRKVDSSGIERYTQQSIVYWDHAKANCTQLISVVTNHMTARRPNG